MKTEPNTPTVSVLMCVFNGEKYLREAIDSILCQTFTNFEFIIIDDNSTDCSVDIIRSYTDRRIRLFRNEENIGLTKSLNKGIELARGKYIARMDADDISLPDRLAVQVQFMEENPHIGVCGTWFELFDATNNKIISHPIYNNEIVFKFFIQNAIGHPTVIIRNHIIKKYKYNEEYITAQDYELWVRLATYGIKFHNIPLVLLKYRWHDTNTSTLKMEIQKANANKIIKSMYIHLDIEPCSKNMKIMKSIISDIFPDEISINEILLYIRNLYLKNKEKKFIGEEYLLNILKPYTKKVIYANKKFNIFILPLLYQNRNLLNQWKPCELIKIFVKCIIAWKVQ